jgi:hypothetical protein
MALSWQEFLPWVTSANTLWAVWLNGRNVRLSWKVSLANQALWLVFIVAFGAWGLLPLTLSLAAVFARHLTRRPKPAPAGGTSSQCAPVPSGRRGPSRGGRYLARRPSRLGRGSKGGLVGGGHAGQRLPVGVTRRGRRRGTPRRWCRSHAHSTQRMTASSNSSKNLPTRIGQQRRSREIRVTSRPRRSEASRLHIA